MYRETKQMLNNFKNISKELNQIIKINMYHDYVCRNTQIIENCIMVYEKYINKAMYIDPENRQLKWSDEFCIDMVIIKVLISIQFNILLHRQYLKYYIMYCKTPNENPDIIGRQCSTEIHNRTYYNGGYAKHDNICKCELCTEKEKCHKLRMCTLKECLCKSCEYKSNYPHHNRIIASFVNYIKF